VTGYIPAGARPTDDPDDTRKIAELVAPMVGIDVRRIVALTVVVGIVVGDVDGEVAVVSANAHPMAIVSLLAQGIDRITDAEIEAMGLLG
jgi:hypothetical protein